MYKFLFALLAIGIAIALTACAPVIATPAATAIATTSPIAIAAPTATFVPSATVATTITSAPSATVVVATVTPAPSATAVFPTKTLTPAQAFAQWSNISSPDAKLLQSTKTAYAKAMGIDVSGIHTATQIVQQPNGTFAKIIDQQTGVALLISSTDEKGYTWQEATPGNYWAAYGKHIGPMMNGDEWKYSTNKQLALKYFSDGGILGILGQVRPGPDIEERRPVQATAYLQAAKQARMAFVFNYVVEPGKFPKGSSAENVDQWLNRRLSEISDVIIQNKPSLPVYIQFNEATGDGNGWNKDNNPLKDKYGDKWLGEYLYQALLIPMNKGLIPNKDFVSFVNENKMFSKTSQQFVHDKLSEARMYAFQKLMTDPDISAKLKDLGINRAEEVNVVLGTETYVNLDNRPSNGIVFISDPTIDQIDTLANLFGDLGGIVMSEVSPQGSDEQKRVFLEKLTKTLINNPNARGALLWNTFNNPEDTGDAYMQSPTLLFNPDGTPTKLYYALLSSGN